MPIKTMLLMTISVYRKLEASATTPLRLVQDCTIKDGNAPSRHRIVDTPYPRPAHYTLYALYPSGIFIALQYSSYLNKKN